MSKENQAENKKNNEKRFVTRNSLLIDLFENQHIRIFHLAYLVSFIAFLINAIIHDVFKRGNSRIASTLYIVYKGFENFHLVLVAWVEFFLLSCVCYFGFKIWARKRGSSPHASKLQWWDYFWLLLLLSYYLFAFSFSSYLVLLFDLGSASTIFLLCEVTRLLMKVHSFVFNSTPRVLNHKFRGDDELLLPKLSQFVLFLFVPTLIYKDEYPRTMAIDWKFATYRFAEIIVSFIYLALVIEKYVNTPLQEFGLRKYTVNELIVIAFENTLAGALMLLLLFYIILHSWQNFFAEITRFGDRTFYRDWWTATNYGLWFRTWNVVVHEWLYFYVYKSTSKFVNASLAKMGVFLLSALVHEWILGFAFRFCLPLNFLEFAAIGTILHFIKFPKNNLSNTLMLYSLFFGMGSLVTMYAMEFFARVNVPIENPGLIDYFVPRFLTCDSII